MDNLTEEEYNMLCYFWKTKGDLERWTGWDEVSQRRPDIAQRWGDYKTAKAQARLIFETALDHLSYEFDS